MTLRQKQSEFVVMVIGFIQFIRSKGYEVTFGDAYRDPRCPYGVKKSKHHSRLAIDLNLYYGGKYLRKTEDHRIFGEYWESIGGTWGGRFKTPDGNHYQY